MYKISLKLTVVLVMIKCIINLLIIINNLNEKLNYGPKNMPIKSLFIKMLTIL